MDVEWDELVERSRVWALAEEYYVDNKAHEFPSDNRLEICIESGRQDKMTDHCWMILKAQYAE